jgi:hypothetical protein
MNLKKWTGYPTLFLITLTFLLPMLQSCKSREENKSTVSMDEVFRELNQDIADPSKSNQPETMTLNQGIVTEVLQTDRYTYLELDDHAEKYWIAVTRQPINVGEKIVFSDGILKNNFESKEFNRIFETIYLVSRFQRLGIKSSVPAESVESQDNSPAADHDHVHSDQESTLPGGSVSIDELISNSAAYSEKKVEVTGTVVKVNYNIMGRNWVHIRNQAGNPELTITTTEQVTEGDRVTFEGVIHTQRDFGAGYYYEVIMEGAVLK